MISIVDDSIPVAGHQSVSLGTAGTVTQSDFEGYKAEQKHTLAIIAQKIEGVGYTIGLLTFTTKEELVSHFLRHFPADTYDCIVGLMGLMGYISEPVVSQTTIENQIVMGKK